MRYRHWWMLLSMAAVVGAALSAEPADKPMREAGKMDLVWKADKLVSLISGESLEFTLPAVPARGGVETVIALRTRLQNDRLNGWSPYLAIWVNGRAVNVVDDWGRIRLINRPDVYSNKQWGTAHCMFNNAVCTFFSPSFDQWTFQLLQPVQEREKYWFILRVEDLLFTDRPNVLKFQNTTKFKDFGADKPEEIVVVAEPVEVGYFQKPRAVSSRKVELKADGFQAAQTVKGKTAVVEVNAFGGVKVSRGAGSFVMESSFSWPNAGNNLFGGGLKGCQKEWTPQVSAKGNTITITARGAQHGVRREMRVSDDRIDFFDAIENLTDEILPVMALNAVGLPQTQDVLWISGMPNGGALEVASIVNPCNSTLVINSRSAHVGIYAKDTVLRNQFWVENYPGVAVFGTNQLALAPKSSYTLRWRMYLSDDPDYFGFINRIREDDGLNFTLIGPWEDFFYNAWWAQAKPDEIRDKMSIQCRRIGAGEPWFEYYCSADDPVSYDRAKYKSLSRSAVANVTGVVPGFRMLASREISFFRVPKDPAEWSKHANADSLEKNADGSYVTSGYGCVAPAYQYLYGYMARDNSYYTKMMADVDFLMDECGFKGIYFDIFTLPGVVSYDRWDGYSADIDPKTYALQRKKNNVPILHGPAQTDMVRKIFDKGGIVVCNQSASCEEMLALPVMSFVEGTNNVPSTHLYSPIGLSNMWTNFTDEEQKKASTLVDQITQRLKLGALTYYYASCLRLGPSEYEAYGILTHSFPLTPVGLHAGWIEGKERTVTCMPGKYVWRRARKPQTLVWNADGRRVTPNVPMVQNGDTWTVDLGSLPAGGVAVIEENPYE